MRPQHWFHPDFGIFQPSAELRRTGRITILAAAFGAIAGASVILALLHPDLSLATGNTAWTGYYVHKPPALSDEAVPAPHVETAVTARDDNMAISRSRLDSGCCSSQRRRRHRVHVIPPPSTEPAMAQPRPADEAALALASAGSNVGRPLSRTTAKKRERHRQPPHDITRERPHGYASSTRYSDYPPDPFLLVDHRSR
jgi:hypothetical protein